MFYQIKQQPGAKHSRSFAFSSGSGGKKIHVMRKYVAITSESWEAVCGSGLNWAGQTWKARTVYQIQAAEKIEASKMCKKCAESLYVQEVA
jgi:hypothetical protein